jgi:hypothetical protein
VPVELTVEQKALQALAQALSRESDGKKLRRDMSKNLRAAIEPLRKEAQGNVKSLRASAVAHSNKTRDKAGRFVKLSDSHQSLRQAVADAIKAEGRLSGNSTGARIRVTSKGMPRGFTKASKYLNRKGGWRHPMFNTGKWVQQVASPAGWFDRATQNPGVVSESKDAVMQAMNDMAARIIRGIH